MERYVAFLRAINVGGHTVKMDYLRQVFESFGLSGVETFIASGNVVFEAPTADARALDEQIGQGLREALGYDVATSADGGGIGRHCRLPALSTARTGRRHGLQRGLPGRRGG